MIIWFSAKNKDQEYVILFFIVIIYNNKKNIYLKLNKYIY
jgi:hypothetical protein